MNRIRLVIGGLATATTVAALTAAPIQAAPAGSASSTGVASVFKVNPVQSSGDQTLRDEKDSATAVPASEYATVTLGNLDGSGYLSGAWANVRSTTGALAYSDTNRFVYDRSQDEFEQVMAYYWVDQAQEYLQSLGFGSSLPPILKRPFDVRINQNGIDNSYMWDKKDLIRLGKGGVDDAEDAEVIVHEYGHAVHNDQIPGFGGSFDAGAIGESFGDYLAVSVGLDTARDSGWPVRAPESCPMDWDATSYDPTAPHCIRNFHTGFTIQNRPDNWGIHSVGQIWSQALWEIRLGYIAQGLGSEAWDTTLISSQFAYAPATTFQAAAEATYREALTRDGAKAARLVRDRFAARGITF
ncbi:M36 family metallopeptidase [Nocardioides sp.]|uniref:M36 family metallopeptidase n=1 Tax=Nocardioides sp. TaxID=35761 RepID=UPI002D80DBD9|nr:M36 family metallopeptidase [Nocardioides sp.]HET8961057.1 M36 family metallopeptidase [Nocardioides sp.]